ncbi:hypothetical protein [Pseudonocardia sp. T1-2H]|uniref:hypothetical protein n=1 Tax=Pseudonocardia sp. T1-2H TaxID=3128899 RepID=UPI003100A9AA
MPPSGTITSVYALASARRVPSSAALRLQPWPEFVAVDLGDVVVHGVLDLELASRDLRHTVRRASRGDAGVRRVARWAAGARLSPCGSEPDQRMSEESYGWRRRAGSVSPDWP